MKSAEGSFGYGVKKTTATVTVSQTRTLLSSSSASNLNMNSRVSEKKSQSRVNKQAELDKLDAEIKKYDVSHPQKSLMVGQTGGLKREFEKVANEEKEGRKKEKR